MKHTNPLRPSRQAIERRLRADGQQAASAGRPRDAHPHRGTDAEKWLAGYDMVSGT